jgi:hypothetical protein
LFKFAVDRGIAKRNPVAEISKIKTKTDGHHTWTISEVHKFEERHPLGFVARLQTVLDATNLGQMTFLVSSFGKPFTANGFGNAMR